MKPPTIDFTKTEWRIIQNHKTPLQVQKYLSALSYNHELEKPTCLSFRGVVREMKAHCLEAAISAAVILEQHNYPPLLISIESQDQLDHVLFVFRKNGLFGSVARSRDIGLHGRKPVFRTARDLVMSYYDPYIDKSGRITGYAVADLRELGTYDWRLSEKNVWKVERYLQEIPHREIKGSDKRYARSLSRYLEFHKANPQRSPDYFTDKYLWML
jgi:hypothetical protein